MATANLLMSQALYRKYRSRALDEVVGQEHITDTLARAIKAGRISHAYLFTGPRGTGKTSVARILAYAINDLPYADTTHLDIIEIDAASNRRIDDIRDLREKVHITPVSAKYKIYIIDEVHMLTGESFNALLKTLEEPPSHVVFILATTEAHKLPATIISRTQRFAFRAAAPDKVIKLLKSLAKKEKIAISDEAIALIAEHGNGSFRDSVSLLDQMAHVASGDITIDDVQRTLGLAPKVAMNNLVDSLLAGDHPTAAQSLADLEAQGSSPSSLVQQLVILLNERARANPSLYQLVDQLLDVPRAYNPSLKLLSVLMVFATNQRPDMPPIKPQTAATKVHAPTASFVAKPKILAPKPKPEKAKTEPISKKDTDEESEAKPLTELTPSQWVKVLKAVKKHNAPVFSVLKQALPSFDADSQTLTLAFKYQLHRKKMDDIKTKGALVGFMREKLGATPTIHTVVDPKAKPPILSDDPTVTSVAAIMGGGEVVSAEKI